MAPEQARGRQAQVDARTDIWALGATLFFCLAGRRVHEGAVTANEALIFAATQRAPPLSKSARSSPTTWSGHRSRTGLRARGTLAERGSHARSVGAGRGAPVAQRDVAGEPGGRHPRQHACGPGRAGTPLVALASLGGGGGHFARRYGHRGSFATASARRPAGVAGRGGRSRRSSIGVATVDGAGARVELEGNERVAGCLRAPPALRDRRGRFRPPERRLPRPRKSAKVGQTATEDVPEVLLDQRK